MRNIIIFLRIYSTFFFFLFLMILSLYLLFNYNSFQNTVYSKAASEISGSVNDQYNKVSYYFYLKKVNDSLVKENETLYNKLREDYNIPDTVNGAFVDSLSTDSLGRYRRFEYMYAKIVRNSVSKPNNYIVMHRGSRQGVTPDLGVIGVNGGVIGTVLDVSDNFCVVMSLLHSQSNVSARLKKGQETGMLVWDGMDKDILLLKNISKSARINAGDTVVTSGFSDKFPKGLVLGYVKDIINDKSTPTYTVRIHPSVNFETLQFGYIIDNLQKDEADDLLKKVKNK